MDNDKNIKIESFLKKRVYELISYFETTPLERAIDEHQVMWDTSTDYLLASKTEDELTEGEALLRKILQNQPPKQNIEIAIDFIKTVNGHGDIDQLIDEVINEIPSTSNIRAIFWEYDFDAQVSLEAFTGKNYPLSFKKEYVSVSPESRILQKTYENGFTNLWKPILTEWFELLMSEEIAYFNQIKELYFYKTALLFNHSLHKLDIEMGFSDEIVFYLNEHDCEAITVGVLG